MREPRTAPSLVLLVSAAILALGAVGCARLQRLWSHDEVCELGEEVEGGHAEPALLEPVDAPKKRAWEAAHGGQVAARPFVRARMNGWPSLLSVEGASLPEDPEEFARRVALDTWRGLEALHDRDNGLPVDHVHLDDTPAGPPEGVVGDYANVTNVGLRMLAIVAAERLGYLDEAGAIARIGAMLDTLDGLERHHGFFLNYYDTTTLERTSNLLSFVDSSWLIAGLIVVRNRHPELAARATALVDAMDYGLFYDDDLGRMTHGFYVQKDRRSRYHYGVLFAESRLGSVIAIGRGEAPPTHWYRMIRTFHRAAVAVADPEGAREKYGVEDEPYLGGWYEWEGIRYVPSWGGSMFEALMPTLVLDEPRLAPASLGANDAAHVEVQRRFAGERLGYPVWGLSPSYEPGPSREYGEYGVKPLGAIGYGTGAVTPHAAALALAVDPARALADLQELARRFPVYGDWGFYDSVDPASGAVAHTYLTLDQAMTFVALANHLTDHHIQRLFESDPIVARALPVIAAERFFE
ncbi:MAG: DUF3131 domain-containing protein [Deltaproteobacteria bacterium]|nr:DUF3131 domain-containing protein [Deltaproteobacteria bacterium]